MPRRHGRARHDPQHPDIAMRPRRVKYGIALKFAIPIGIVTTLLIAGFGWSLYQTSRDALEDRIVQDGLFAARAAAAPDWHNPDNRSRLQELVSGAVEDVIVWEIGADGRQRFIDSATGREKLEMAPDASYHVRQGATIITRGRVRSTSGSWIAYRSFLHPITRPDNPNKVIGKVEVILSEAAIEEQLGGIRNRIVLFTILGIALGIGVCWATARAITRPLHDLIRDVKTVAKGNLNHRTQIRSADEVGLLAEAVDNMTRELEKGLQVKADLSSKEHDEQIAQEIQERLLPRELPTIDGAEIDAAFEAAGEIASDMFDVMRLNENETGFLVMSASGRGVPAAIILAMARSIFRSVATRYDGPAETLKALNAVLAPDLRRGMYVTCVYVVHHRTDNRVHVASAGHKMPLMVFVAERGSIGRSHPGGIAMGLDEGPIFDSSLEEVRLSLSPGDTILCGTDGLARLSLPNGEELGEKRFMKIARDILRSGAEQPARAILDAVDRVVADEQDAEHDVTLLTLTRSRETA